MEAIAVTAVLLRPKHEPYRSRRLLDLAHELHECTLTIPGVCQGYVPEGLEPAHGPKSLLGGGVGQKSHDIFAAACHACHAELDQGRLLSRRERHEIWAMGAAKTWVLLLERGWLKVAERAGR